LKSRKRKHRPHLDAKHIPEFMTALSTYHGGLKVRLAMQLLWSTFVRPGELRNARWEDIDEENAMWRIPAEQMKMKRPHLVPLSPQALQLLKELRPVSGKSKLLFPSANNPEKPISDVTLTKALIILKFKRSRRLILASEKIVFKRWIIV
jgi:integrase